jgi:hypothetical protein
MFEWIKCSMAQLFSTRVTFADGSYIEWFNREAILYVEPGFGKMEIPWTFRSSLVRGRTLRLADVDRWDAPNEAKPVTAQKREEVLDKIREYCRKRGIPLSVIE